MIRGGPMVRAQWSGSRDQEAGSNDKGSMVRGGVQWSGAGSNGQGPMVRAQWSGPSGQGPMARAQWSGPNFQGSMFKAQG